MEGIDSFLVISMKIILYYFFVVIGGYFLLSVYAGFSILRRYTQKKAEDIYKVITSDALPSIAFIIPAYNEEKTILYTLNNILNISYRYKEILIVNDGSTDGTFELLRTHFVLKKIPPTNPGTLITENIIDYYQSTTTPSLRVINKINGGKADALNAGINACTSPIFISVDSDTLITEHGLNHLVYPFLKDDMIIAAGGGVRIINGCSVVSSRITSIEFPQTLLARIQVIEYLRSFFVERLGWNWSRGALIVAGAFAMFKTEPVREIGGYNRQSITEDMEIVVRLHRFMQERKRKYRITFIPDPVAWTEVPETWIGLWKQRRRWQQGLLQTIWDNKSMICNPRYGVVGCINLPFLIFAEVCSPFVELIGYIILTVGALSYLVDWTLLWVYFAICWGLAVFLSLGGVLFEELTYRKYADMKHVVWMMFLAVVEHLGYRQFLLIARLQAFVDALVRGRKWHTVRKGFLKTKQQVEPIPVEINE